MDLAEDLRALHLSKPMRLEISARVPLRADHGNPGAEDFRAETPELRSNLNRTRDRIHRDSLLPITTRRPI